MDKENGQARLVRLLDAAMIEAPDNYGMPNSAFCANYLLNHNVLAPLCKVGDTVYRVKSWYGDEPDIYEETVKTVSINDTYGIFYDTRFSSKELSYTADFREEDIGKDVFLNMEQAESALHRQRLMLKQAPCEVGDEVFLVLAPCLLMPRVVTALTNEKGEIWVHCGWICFRENDFGKTVFLKREAALQAMEMLNVKH